ncbi:MAG: FCD domain-containing protein, partial [Yoonia sp.]
DVRDIAMVRCEVEKLALSRAIELGDIAWEGRVMAAHHALQKAEAAAATNPDDLIALEWDEACRAFSFALTDACDSPRLIDLQRKFFDQSRRFRLEQMREGRLDWAARQRRQKGLLEAVLARQAEDALTLLQEDVAAELRQ